MNQTNNMINIEEMINLINQQIRPFLNMKDGFNDPIIEVIDYAFNPGGKRLRPMFLALTYEMLSGDSHIKVVAPYMAALEMIHTYSLVHDDLPALDNDNLRRGKPSTHIVYGEDMAILAGDALLNLAYEVLFDELNKHPGHANIMAAKTISDCAGLKGMVGGQVVDVINENKTIDNETLQYIHENKTAKLITAAFVSAGYVCKSNEITISKLEDIGKRIGLAFQIQDDVLDIVGNEEILGKPIQSDIKNQKQTYVSIHGLDASKKRYEKLYKEAIALIESINPVHSAKLIQLITFISKRAH